MIDSADLKDRLIAVTIGGASGARDVEEIRNVFHQYLSCALPDFKILSVEPIITAASLNSIIGRIHLESLQTSEKFDTVAKVHIESHAGEQHLSSAAGVREYEHAQLLEEYGWPTLSPLAGVELHPDYPVLVYPYTEARTYFDLLEDSYRTQKPLSDEHVFTVFEEFEAQAGKASVASAKSVPSESLDSAEFAPVQALFYERVKPEGRIDQWYKPETEFILPGAGPVAWGDLKSKRWRINGVDYKHTLHEVVELSRILLSYDGTGDVVVAMSHGDDHAGNVFYNKATSKAITFDPAFGGWNPGALCDVKSFMHTGILPMAGLYYPPQLKRCEYSVAGDVIEAGIDWDSCKASQAHQRFARSTVDNRIKPLFSRMVELGASLESERSRFAMAAATCCYLVINVAGLLSNKAAGSCEHGTGEALLPLTVMCAAMRGLPQLDYCNEMFDALGAL